MRFSADWHTRCAVQLRAEIRAGSCSRPGCTSVCHAWRGNDHAANPFPLPAGDRTDHAESVIRLLAFFPARPVERVEIRLLRDLIRPGVLAALAVILPRNDFHREQHGKEERASS